MMRRGSHAMFSRFSQPWPITLRFVPAHQPDKADHTYHVRQQRSPCAGQAHGEQGVREEGGGQIGPGHPHQNDGQAVVQKGQARLPRAQK